MATLPYIGNGPYCYANCLAMMLGRDAPSPAVIEVATCSPFGMQIIDGMPFFDPEGWDPLLALDDTMNILGWKSEEFIGKDTDTALARLKQELKNGPVFVGPVDLSGLSYQPGPPGADHYVVVLSIDDMVHVHDPNGFPYVVLPVKDFMGAWGTRLPYGQPFTMRFNFQKVKTYSEEEIIKRTIPEAQKWLARGNNEDSATKAAELVNNLHPALRGHLAEFAVRVGARRISDAATCLARIEGYEDAVKTLNEQAKLLGSLQYYVRVKNSAVAGQILVSFGQKYNALRQALAGGDSA